MRPTNSLNQTENDRRKCRISKRIQRNSIEDSTGGANEKKNIECDTFRDNSSYLKKIKIHWKNRLNRSFDAEFNALPDYVILIEKIDLENVGKNKTKMECSTFTDNSSYLRRFFQD